MDKEACLNLISFHDYCAYFQQWAVPLIGKDGDDVIDKITCELMGTESINTQT